MKTTTLFFSIFRRIDGAIPSMLDFRHVGGNSLQREKRKSIMKKCLLSILVLAFLSTAAAAQAVIENPAKPLSGNAGRLVTLKEEMRIEDTGGGYYFKKPRTIRVSPRGDIFVQDEQAQALLFDPQGRFVRNLYKNGQGPGELTALVDIWVSSDRLFLLGYPPKILVYKFDGALDKEISLRDLGFAQQFIWAKTDGLLVKVEGQPDLKVGAGFREIPQDIIEIAPDASMLKRIGSFPIRGFIQVWENGAKRISAWNQLKVIALDSNSLFLNSTPEYLVENFARDKGAVVRRFRRPYARVKSTGGGVISGPGGSGPPPPEFRPDIYALHAVDGKIWVQTSTVVAGKGILFDVYDPEGRFLDSFYIQTLMKDRSGNPINMSMTIAGGFAFVRDKTEDELIVIKKCRLVGL
jgi:hypothetical protein